MSSLRVPSVVEVRERIDAIREEDYLIPSPSAKFPDGVRRIDGAAVKITSKLALIGGFRISEIVNKPLAYTPKGTRTPKKNLETEQMFKTLLAMTDDPAQKKRMTEAYEEATYVEPEPIPKPRNTSNSLKMWIDIHKDTGEEVLRIDSETLKKKRRVRRELGIPFSPEHEPFARDVYEAYEKTDGAPCPLNRIEAWYVNRIAFDGLGYEVTSGQHIKPAGNHFLRHIRAIELKDMQLLPEERVSFFKWSARGLGMNPMIMTYSQAEWHQYFSKLLKYKRR